MSAPAVSVVVPVYNEEAGLTALFARLYPALDALDMGYEIVFVNDGSRDRSAAIMAGFAHCRGERVITLDADLQNPPEEIPRLLAGMDAGHDYVGGIRRARRDSVLRRAASRAMNALRERITRIRMTDQGCMLRAYSRDIVEAINSCREVNTFIPALAWTFARNPVEIEVAHEERAAGTSRYSLGRLIELNFDLITGFSVKPLHLFSLLGMFVAAASVVTYVGVMAARWAASDSVLEGLRAMWDRDILAFFLVGLILFGVGLVGEYVGRIYEQVRHRPPYLIDAILERRD